MAKKKTKFCCQSCGYESPKWLGRCPGCGEWNTFVEEVEDRKLVEHFDILMHQVKSGAYRQC